MTDFSKGFRELREFDQVDRFQSDYAEKNVVSNRQAIMRKRTQLVTWLLAALGIVGIVLAVALVVSNGRENWRVVYLIQDRSDRQFLIAALEEIRNLRDANGTPEEWDQLEAKLIREAEPLIKYLERRASPKEPQRQLLLQSLKAQLPAALDHGRQERCVEEELIELTIDQVGKLMNLKYQESISR